MPEAHAAPQVFNHRIPDAQVDSQFLDRWSPRAFSPEPLPASMIATLFEAVRWAPSSGNEQPWTYVYAVAPQERERFLTILDDSNRVWVKNAPMLAFVMCRLIIARSGKRNRHAQFDSGASWMSLALQARKLGLYAHAMAGFDVEKAHAILNVPKERHEIMAAIAIGRYGDPSVLDERNQAREKPSSRKPAGEFVFEGPLPDTAL